MNLNNMYLLKLIVFVRYANDSFIFVARSVHKIESYSSDIDFKKKKYLVE